MEASAKLTGAMSANKNAIVTVLIAAAGVFAAATAVALIKPATDFCDQRCAVAADRNGGLERRIVVKRRTLALIYGHDNVSETREAQPALLREAGAALTTRPVAPVFGIVALFAFLAGFAHRFGAMRGGRFGAAS